MKMSAPRQRNAVSEGMALGLVAWGYDRIAWDKARIDAAFESATIYARPVPTSASRCKPQPTI